MRMALKNTRTVFGIAASLLLTCALGAPAERHMEKSDKSAAPTPSEPPSKTLTGAKLRPLWEIGIGAGALNHNYYTGTDQTNNYVFPIILPIYRGDVLKSDDKGVRALLINEPKFKLGISLDFNPALESEEITLRQGMPNIENLLQVGPAIEYTLQETPREHWTIKLPLRAAFEVEFGQIRGRGYNLSPTLSFVHQHSDHPWKQGFSAALQWGTDHYHTLYYGVSPEYAQPGRLPYQPESGYAGARLQWAFSARYPRHLMVFFLRYDYIKGAVFEDSPLVETDHNITAGFLFSYSVLQSKTLVAHPR